MGFRLYKSVGLGKGVRLNLSKTGVGISAGVPGLRYSVHSSGRTVKTAGVPGTGVYYRKDTYAKRGGSGGARTRTAAPQVAMFPKAGVLAPKEDKLFVKGVTTYMQGRHEEALALFRDVMSRDQHSRHVGEEFFAGMCLVALQRLDEAIEPFETVIASEQAIPDPLMSKYGVGGRLQVQITHLVEAEVEMSSLGAALMLAEVYQHTDRAEKAIELLESLGSVAPDPIFALSLAELYSQADRAGDIVRVTEGFARNTDDATAQLLIYRADALRDQGLNDAALAVLKEALKSRSRTPTILLVGRYVRAVTFQAMGKKTQARRDFERIYAEDATFADVAKRLSQ